MTDSTPELRAVRYVGSGPLATVPTDEGRILFERDGDAVLVPVAVADILLAADRGDFEAAEGEATRMYDDLVLIEDGEIVLATDLDTPGPVALESLTKPELQELARQRELPTSGTKAELVDAIVAADTAEPAPPVGPAATGDVAGTQTETGDVAGSNDPPPDPAGADTTTEGN